MPIVWDLFADSAGVRQSDRRAGAHPIVIMQMNVKYANCFSER